MSRWPDVNQFFDECECYFELPLVGGKMEDAIEILSSYEEEVRAAACAFAIAYAEKCMAEPRARARKEIGNEVPPYAPDIWQALIRERARCLELTEVAEIALALFESIPSIQNSPNHEKVKNVLGK